MACSETYHPPHTHIKSQGVHVKISKDSVMRVARVKKKVGHDNFQGMASKNLSQVP